MDKRVNQIYEFADFRLNKSERQLSHEGKLLPLTPRAFDLLVVLVEHQGSLVSKDELMRKVWADSFVEEANLNVNISTLRKALGQNSFIETVTKKGYRFTVDVREVNDTETVFEKYTKTLIVAEEGEEISDNDLSPKLLPRKPKKNIPAILAVIFLILGATAFYFYSRNGERVSGEIKTLAVLPFKSLTREADDHLGIGIADTIIGKVSRIEGVIVRPTSAVQKYSDSDVNSLEAAQQLGVDAVLDGTVQHVGDRLRVSANLLRAGDGASLWTDSFDMSFTDIFTIEDEVSKQVAAQLQLKLNSTETARLAKRHTANAEAFEHYARGVQIFNGGRVGRYGGDKNRAAAEEFKKAVEIDPNYGLAHAQLAYLYALIAIYYETGNPNFLGLARQEIRAADALDSQLAETHLARYEIYFSAYENFQIDDGVRELRLAQQLDPNAGHIQMAHLYGHLGLEEPALRELKRAMEIDPTSEVNRGRYVNTQEMLGKYDEAIIAGERYFPDQPERGAFYSYLWLNRLDEAQKSLDAGLAHAPNDENLESLRVLLLAVRGKLAEADAEIPKIAAMAKPSRGFHHIAHDIAAVYALEGKTQQSVEWLKKAADTGLPNYPMFARDPNFARIRNDEVFVRFMTELKTRWENYNHEFQ
ncbi:MAG: winged helix-turn-helix domain-containing protein [Acidobacteriota bacterium]|nr:winged helix-turn-helix domain-containing protein [Acidobacteriota bacterium]